MKLEPCAHVRLSVLGPGQVGGKRWCPARQVRLSKRLCHSVEDVFGELEATALEGGTDRRHVRVAEQEEDVDGVHVLLKETSTFHKVRDFETAELSDD